MNVALRRPMSREEFFDWDGHGEGRYEFDGVRPVAMTGGNLGHSGIVVNLLAELRSRLAGTSYVALGPDAGIGTVGERVRYPDAVVTSSPFLPDDMLLPDPVVVFEVVSPGSRHRDRVVKLAEYQAVPSTLRYVMVDTRPIGASVLARRRGGDAFERTRLQAGAAVALPEIGIELPLDSLYARALP